MFAFEKKRIYLLIFIFAFITLFSVGLSLYTMYLAALEESRLRLTEIAHSQARMIEAISHFDQKHFKIEGYSKERAWEASMSQVRQAHSQYRGFGETGEFTLAKQENGYIVFLLSHRHFDLKNPRPVPLDSSLAEPMRKALTGQSGTLIGLDYRGVLVVAAYEPLHVPIGQLGIVAKMDLAEIREPFILTGTSTLFLVFTFIGLGGFFFFKIAEPMILQKKKMEEERLKIETRYRLLFENMRDGFGAIDLDFRFIEANQSFCDIIGYTKEELKQLSIIDITPDYWLDKESEMMQQLTTKSATDLYEKEYIKKDGSLVPVELWVSHLKVDQEIIGYWAMVRDITERKQVEDALHEKEELMITQSRQVAMGEMVAMIAHQWRQPITTVTMIANNILMDLQFNNTVDTQQLTEDMDKVVEQTHYLSQTIDDFRNFFNPQNEYETTTVSKIVQEAISIIGKSFENHHIALEIEDKHAVPMPLYSKELVQVLLIVLNNAKDAILAKNRKQGQVTITIDTDNNQQKITISDNGGGIPPHLLQKLGEPYVSTKLAHGTGLGLYMAKIIISKHMLGNITWNNSHQGAIITIIIPIQEKAKDNEKS